MSPSVRPSAPPSTALFRCLQGARLSPACWVPLLALTQAGACAPTRESFPPPGPTDVEPAYAGAPPPPSDADALAELQALADLSRESLTPAPLDDALACTLEREPSCSSASAWSEAVPQPRPARLPSCLDAAVFPAEQLAFLEPTPTSLAEDWNARAYGVARAPVALVLVRAAEGLVGGLGLADAPDGALSWLGPPPELEALVPEPEEGQGVTLRHPQPSMVLTLEGEGGPQQIPLRQVVWSATFTASCNLARVYVDGLLDLDAWSAQALPPEQYAHEAAPTQPAVFLQEGPREGQPPAGTSGASASATPREVPVRFVFQAQALYLTGP